MKKDSFQDYKDTAANWITMANGDFYPDILADACELYKPVLVMFGQLLKTSETSIRLLKQITEISQPWMRVELDRVFRKYVSPQTPVEMLKKKSLIPMVCEQYGRNFRPIEEVQAAFESRPLPDEALCAVLWEYKDRGKKGYDLTERFFELFRMNYPDFKIEGPERAGTDIRLGDLLDDYPNAVRPVDFVIRNAKGTIAAIGLARYDGDRGGAQEDDRTGGYTNCAKEILEYARSRGVKLRVVFLNDGPGLLLGTMWNDYAKLENVDAENIKVVTLRMVCKRITKRWLNFD